MKREARWSRQASKHSLGVQRPTNGYCRITAIPKHQLRFEGLAVVNHKACLPDHGAQNLFLQRFGFHQPERKHDGKVIILLSTLCWSVGLLHQRLTGSLQRWLGVPVLKWQCLLVYLHFRCA